MPSITLTLDTANAQRVVKAVGKIVAFPNPPRDATVAEVKEFLMNYMKQLVVNSEKNDALAALNVVPPDIT